ncbi:hypothetical protein [Olsenella uli]|uniref:hypothetical protein n=1 Tax=Olsenella uli TaxID=133926 RepID=UPI00044D5F28|nr:hypothetical protein [Olsenella uli]EUB31380.1 hypothetical protein HMPREF1503_1727 [Olsenella uli MSTE5]
MATDGEIRVVYKNVDEVISKLRSLAGSAEGIAGTDYALAITTGSGGAALVGAGTAVNDFATRLSTLIARTADRVEQARAEYEGADFGEASRLASIGVGHSGGGSDVGGVSRSSCGGGPGW